MIKEVEEFYSQYSVIKGPDQLICIFDFTYAKSRFFHDTAHIIMASSVNRNMT